MKVIPLQGFPIFYGLSSEDSNAFLFEFVFLYRGYDYTIDPKKMNLSPSTLKGVTLQWFMGLEGGVTNSWDE